MLRADRRTLLRTGRRGLRARRTRVRTRRMPTRGDGGRTRLRSRSAIQIGMLPTRSAATPAGTVCCAQASDPCPSRKSNPPKTNPATTCFRPIGSAVALAARNGDDEQRSSRDEVSGSHGQVGRQIAYRDREGDERRAPDDVDRHQGEPDPRVPTRRHAGKDARPPDDQLKSSSPLCSIRSPNSANAARHVSPTCTRTALVRIESPCRVSLPRDRRACPGAGRTLPSSS